LHKNASICGDTKPGLAASQTLERSQGTGKHQRITGDVHSDVVAAELAFNSDTS
jgi:hypothetical protein